MEARNFTAGASVLFRQSSLSSTTVRANMFDFRAVPMLTQATCIIRGHARSLVGTTKAASLHALFSP